MRNLTNNFEILNDSNDKLRELGNTFIGSNDDNFFDILSGIKDIEEQNLEILKRYNSFIIIIITAFCFPAILKLLSGKDCRNSPLP